MVVGTERTRSSVSGRGGRPSSHPEAAAEYVFTPTEREIVRTWNAPLIVGDPDEVRDQLEALAIRTGVDEMMITTMVHGADDRLRSYELLAEAWDPASVTSR